MALFQSLVDGLRKAERELEAQLAGVKAAISALIEGGGSVGHGRKRGRPPASRNMRSATKGIIIVGGKKRKRRKLSAAGRKAISKAQKARWAKQKAEPTRKGSARRK